MFRKTHTAEARKLISKPGQLNPMFGKTHTLNTKLVMSNRKGKAVSLYNKKNVYILTFRSSVELAKFLLALTQTKKR
jgi:hypothetical protein